MGINDVNQLYLSGEVQGVPVFDHSAYGEKFFCAFLCCRRLSGTVDTLPVLAPQPLAVQLRPGLRLAVDVHFERQVHLHLPLPGVDRPFHDPRQCNVRLADTHATSRLRGVEFRIGSLPGSEREGNLLRHIIEFCLQK